MNLWPIREKLKNDSFFFNISQLLTLKGVVQKENRFIKDQDLTLIKDAVMIVDSNGKIHWSGKYGNHEKHLKELLKKEKRPSLQKVNLQGAALLPGFVESHTHLVFAGQRSQEFEMRTRGISYREIAAKGGGILSTMKATRKTSSRDLLDLATQRVHNFIRQGITTLEIKSGYGLNIESEIKILNVIKTLQKNLPINILPTFLGAHAFPPPQEISKSDYFALLENKMLPLIKKKNLSNRVDIFIEKDFFEGNDPRTYSFLTKAQQMGFDLTIHADQLTLSGGTELGINLGALSVDHVLNITPDLVAKLAPSPEGQTMPLQLSKPRLQPPQRSRQQSKQPPQPQSTQPPPIDRYRRPTCVLLPTADLYMKLPFPPARALLDSGASVALATDFNPGSAPSQDVTLVGLLARLKMGMTLTEVISSYTFGGATALGLEKHRGALIPGYFADFITLNKNASYEDLFYSVGSSPVDRVFCNGKEINIQ